LQPATAKGAIRKVTGRWPVIRVFLRKKISSKLQWTGSTITNLPSTVKKGDVAIPDWRKGH
jgi:hypothetical protein